MGEFDSALEGRDSGVVEACSSAKARRAEIMVTMEARIRRRQEGF